MVVKSICVRHYRHLLRPLNRPCALHIRDWTRTRCRVQLPNAERPPRWNDRQFSAGGSQQVKQVSDDELLESLFTSKEHPIAARSVQTAHKSPSADRGGDVEGLFSSIIGASGRRTDTVVQETIPSVNGAGAAAPSLHLPSSYEDEDLFGQEEVKAMDKYFVRQLEEAQLQFTSDSWSITYTWERVSHILHLRHEQPTNAPCALPVGVVDFLEQLLKKITREMPRDSTRQILLPEDVLVFYEKCGLQKFWWHDVLWIQLGILVQNKALHGLHTFCKDLDRILHTFVRLFEDHRHGKYVATRSGKPGSMYSTGEEISRMRTSTVQERLTKLFGIPYGTPSANTASALLLTLHYTELLKEEFPQVQNSNYRNFQLYVQHLLTEPFHWDGVAFETCLESAGIPSETVKVEAAGWLQSPVKAIQRVYVQPESGDRERNAQSAFSDVNRVAVIRSMRSHPANTSSPPPSRLHQPMIPSSENVSKNSQFTLQIGGSGRPSVASLSGTSPTQDPSRHLAGAEPRKVIRRSTGSESYTSQQSRNTPVKAFKAHHQPSDASHNSDYQKDIAQDVATAMDAGNATDIARRVTTSAHNVTRQVWNGEKLSQRPHALFEDGTSLFYQRANELTSTEDRKGAIELWNIVSKAIKHRSSLTKDDVSRVFARLLRLFNELQAMQQTTNVWNAMVEKGMTPENRHWNAMISGCSHSRDLKSIEGIWQRMLACGVKPDEELWTAYIHGVIRAGEFQQGLQLLDDLIVQWTSQRKNIQLLLGPVHGALSAFLDMKAKWGRHAIARMQQNIILWARSRGIRPVTQTFNILLEPMIRVASPSEITDHLKTMSAENCQPDIVTWTLIISGIVSPSSTFFRLDPEEQNSCIQDILASMSKHYIYPSPQTYTTLVYGLLDSKRHRPNISAARLVLDHMHEANVSPSQHIYTVLLTHYFQSSPPNLSAASSLLQSLLGPKSRMRDQLGPFFWNKVIESYADVDEWEKALYYLRNRPLRKEGSSWTALAKLLGSLRRAGERDLAEEVVKGVESGKLNRGVSGVGGGGYERFCAEVEGLRQERRADD